MYLLVTNNCESYTLLQIIYLVKVALQIISIAIPVILIVQLIIKFVKAMSLGEEAIRKVTSSVIKTVIPAVIIFFVPFIVTFAFSLLGSGDFKAAACWDEATAENVQKAKVNERIAKYESQAENIKEQLSVVVEKLSGNITDEEQAQVDEVYQNLDKAFSEKDVSEASSSVKDLRNLYKELDNKYRELVWEDIKSKIDELIKSSGASSDGLALVMQYESHEGYCDDTQTTYKAANIGDGTVTVGYGVTNYNTNLAVSLGFGQYFPMSPGDCVPVNVADTILAQDYAGKQQKVEQELAKYNITWKQNQIDAVVSLAYNCGDSYIPKLVKAYAEGGDQGIWDNGFNTCIRASNGNPAFNEGLMRRRKSEYNLFLTGTYERGW